MIYVFQNSVKPSCKFFITLKRSKQAKEETLFTLIYLVDLTSLSQYIVMFTYTLTKIIKRNLKF